MFLLSLAPVPSFPACVCVCVCVCVQSLALWLQSLHASSLEYNLERVLKVDDPRAYLPSESSSSSESRMLFYGNHPAVLTDVVTRGSFADHSTGSGVVVLADTLDIANRYFVASAIGASASALSPALSSSEAVSQLAALAGRSVPAGSVVRWRAAVVSVDLARVGGIPVAGPSLSGERLLVDVGGVDDGMAALIDGSGGGVRGSSSGGSGWAQPGGVRVDVAPRHAAGVVGAGSSVFAFPAAMQRHLCPCYLIEYTFRFFL